MAKAWVALATMFVSASSVVAEEVAPSSEIRVHGAYATGKHVAIGLQAGRERTGSRISFVVRGAGALADAPIALAGTAVADEDGFCDIRWMTPLTGPFVVEYAFADGTGSNDPVHTLQVDADWLPDCGLPDDEPSNSQEVYACRVERALVDSSVRAGRQRVRVIPADVADNAARIFVIADRATPDIMSELARGPWVLRANQSSDIPLRFFAAESNGGDTKIAAFIPWQVPPRGVGYRWSRTHYEGMDSRVAAVARMLETQGIGSAHGPDTLPPSLDGPIETKTGPGASVLLRFPQGVDRAKFARFIVDMPTGPRSILVPLIGEYGRLGCVDCRSALNLPENTDVRFHVRLVDSAGNESAPVHLVVRTPNRLAGRNGHASTGAWHPVVRPSEENSTRAPEVSAPSTPKWGFWRVLVWVVLRLVVLGVPIMTFLQRRKLRRARDEQDAEGDDDGSVR